MKSQKNILLILILLLLSGAVAWNSFFQVYVQRDTVNVHLFPAKIDGWVAREIPISDGDYQILETRNAFSREYKSSQGDSVVVFIVYSQTNRKVSHPPEICYTGSGATILSKTLVTLDLGAGMAPLMVNRFAAEQGADKQMTYYWFKVGNSFTPNYWKQQILIAIKTLLGQPASSALIRLSVPAKEGEELKADNKVLEFARLILPAVQQYLP